MDRTVDESGEVVSFVSSGAQIVGRWWRPVRSPGPVVVMAHGFSATITMVAIEYARSFARAGLGVLLYDHRGFGASGGRPRHEINAWVQAREYLDALDWVRARSDVVDDRVAVWGDSFTGAVATVVAAVDDRVAAVVAQVPATGREPAPHDPDGELADAVIATVLTGEVDGPRTRRVGPMPVVSADQSLTRSLLQPSTAHAWFSEYGNRPGADWSNEATRVVPDTPAPFHAGLVAPRVRCPVLFQVSPVDEMPGADPAVARGVFDRLAGRGTWQEVEGGHFGLLHHPSRWFDDASERQVAFLRRHLVPDPA